MDGEEGGHLSESLRKTDDPPDEDDDYARPPRADVQEKAEGTSQRREFLEVGVTQKPLGHSFLVRKGEELPAKSPRELLFQLQT